MSIIRLNVNFGRGSSLGNMLDELAGERLSERYWLEVEELTKGEFTVVGDNFTGHPRKGLERGITAWTAEVSDLDGGFSDVGQCFGMSERLQWRDVSITPDSFRAPSVRKLKEALTRVVFCAYDPGDI